MRECTNSGRQVARATTFFTVAPNVSGSSVWNLLRVLSGAQIFGVRSLMTLGASPSVPAVTFPSGL
jgi:hypothetical protein